MAIDFYTGQIAVNMSGAIDADIPPRWNLYYTVIASDRCYADDPADCPPDPTFWDTEGNVSEICKLSMRGFYVSMISL